MRMAATLRTPACSPILHDGRRNASVTRTPLPLPIEVSRDGAHSNLARID